MTIGPAPICIWCKRYRDDGPNWGDPPTCEAFPARIPDKILEGFDHRQPFKGDGGVRFDARTDIPMDWKPL